MKLPSPSPGSPAKPVVPVFPLPHLFLFPGGVLPLHVFEPRYRQMIEDLLDRPGRLVLGTILDDAVDADGKPCIHPIAGLGEIGRHERLPDGRFLIWLVGLARVRLTEVESDRLYRRVAIEPVVEVDVPPHEVPALRARVQEALLQRCPDLLNLPPNLQLTHLVDLLSQKIGLPPSTMADLYSEVDLRRRAERTLAEHAARPQGG